jgi:large subunit ribosomal protein L29
MKIKELRQKKVADLHKLLKSNREELRALRFSISSEQEKNVRKMRDVRKNIAKILTLLNNENNKKEVIKEEKPVEKKEEVKKEKIKEVKKSK